MINNIELKTVLARDGYDYLLDKLSVVDVVPSDATRDRFYRGYFSTLVPSATSQARLLNFKSGLILPPNPIFEQQGHPVSRTPDTISETSQLLANKLSKLSSPKLYVSSVMEDESELQSEGKMTVKLSELTFSVYENSLNEPAKIADMLWSLSLPWYYLAFLTDSNSSPISFEDLLNTARIVVIGAYDGESYLLWEADEADLL